MEAELINKNDLLEALLKLPGVGSNSNAMDIIKRFESVKQEKVRVPEFVANYIEWCKVRNWKLTAIALTSNAEYFESHSEPSGLNDWIVKNYQTFLIAIVTNDFVIEETRFYIKLLEKPVDNEEKYLVHELEEDRFFLDKIGENNKKYKMQFTKDEISNIDERYLAFAVPVN